MGKIGLKNEQLKSNEIVFITKAKFPDENAFATYVGGIASVFKMPGYDVFCIGNGNSGFEKESEAYFGKYVSLRFDNCNSLFSKAKNQLFLEKRIFNFVKKSFKEPSHIFFSCDFSLSFYKKVKQLFDNKKTKFSFIITEEFTKDEFEKYTVLSKRALKINHHFIYEYNDDNDSFITISKYLFKKLSDRNLKCVYVPFCFNFSYISSNRKITKTHDGINYIYCGSPENKDLLPIILQAFSSLGEKAKANNIHLNVVGVDNEWALKHNVASIDNSVISFQGRQNKQFVFDAYSLSDYSILIRDENKTFAKAGFPTKISESMVLGVTPITNLTSNLSDYLNENNSIIVNGYDVDDVLKAIEFSIKDFKNNNARKECALKTAKENFDIEKYKDTLLSLISR